MAETVTGKLLDFGLSSINGLDPVLIFQANKPAVTSTGSFLVTDPIEVTPTSGGNVTVDLSSTDDLVTADVYYTLSAEWRAPDLNFTRADFPDWKLYVPSGGGNLADLIKQPTNRSMVIKSPTNPGNNFGNGTLWLQIDPADPNNPLNPGNTGDLYEMRNA
jgi:hypothetical protein